RVRAELYGSLAKTGKGHGTDLAVLLGLSGEDPVTCDTGGLRDRVDANLRGRRLRLGGEKVISFDAATDLLFHHAITLPFHPNGLPLPAFLADGTSLTETYYSIGGGFVVQQGQQPDASHAVRMPLPVESAVDLLHHCEREGLNVAEVVRRNEQVWRSTDE